MSLHYSKDHEWVRVEGDLCTVGITEHAQEQLGDVVFVELPTPGRVATQGDAVAVVESVKAASDIYSPLSGEIVESNAALVETPALVNGDAEGAAWFFKLRLSDPAELDGLMDRAAYDNLLATLV